MHEIETTVLDIKKDAIEERMKELGAEETLRTRFVVDWFHPIGTKEGEDLWFLRIRTTSDGRSTITWKGKSTVEGGARSHREINLSIGNSAEFGEFFEVIGLERYAHQEKDRISWRYKDWAFDLDEYPGMPPYIEVEGTSAEHVQEGIRLLGLEGNRTSTVGERILIQKEYGLDWYNMRF